MHCELSHRQMDNLTVRHLIPRQYSKRKKLDIGPTINICSPCHKQIHALFDNKQLARELNSIAKLQQEPKMPKFLSWIKKQNPNKRIVVRRQK